MAVSFGAHSVLSLSNSTSASVPEPYVIPTQLASPSLLSYAKIYAHLHPQMFSNPGSGIPISLLPNLSGKGGS